MFNLNDLMSLDECPAPYEPGEELWNDPHISKMMLEAHLSPDTDAASYKPEKIDAICKNLMRTMQLKGGDSIVDLGCGPGLYCARLSQRGYRMTGIDRSENSIQYAKTHDTKTRYILGSYLDSLGSGQFDAAMMVSQDYGVLNLESRKTLLRNIRNALKPGGYFAFDVCSMAAFQSRQDAATQKWYSSRAGFWRPDRHFVLEKTIFYPDIHALCDFMAVLDSDGVKTYHIYQTFFSPETIRAELEQNGFRIEAIQSELTGKTYDSASLEIGVICRRV